MDALAAFDPPPVIGEGDEEEMVLDAERLVAIVEGPKRVGKSTFARSLLNRLLSRLVTLLLRYFGGRGQD